MHHATDRWEAAFRIGLENSAFQRGNQRETQFALSNSALPNVQQLCLANYKNPQLPPCKCVTLIQLPDSPPPTPYLSWGQPPHLQSSFSSSKCGLKLRTIRCEGSGAVITQRQFWWAGYSRG